jgi:hypothetical protein
MLWTLFVILFIMWLLGMVTTCTLGGFIHIGELSLSVKTVRAYRVRILEKLNMKNNAEVTRYAIKEGLVD